MGTDATVGHHYVQEIIFKMKILVDFNALMMGLEFKNDLYGVTLNLSSRQNVDLIIFYHPLQSLQNPLGDETRKPTYSRDTSN